MLTNLFNIQKRKSDWSHVESLTKYYKFDLLILSSYQRIMSGRMRHKLVCRWSPGPADFGVYVYLTFYDFHLDVYWIFALSFRPFCLEGSAAVVCHRCRSSLLHHVFLYFGIIVMHSAQRVLSLFLSCSLFHTTQIKHWLTPFCLINST